MSTHADNVTMLSVRGLSVNVNRAYAAAGEVAAAKAVDNIELAIAAGETLCLVGESGCGKSMTALALMRLLPPGVNICSGNVLLQGRDLLRTSEAQFRGIRGRALAMIFQEPQTSLNPVMRIGEQIGEVLTGLSERQRRAKVLTLLEQVGLSDPAHSWDAFPHQLSGGMKQRVMIAMALAGDPRLLIADEPTTALDVTLQAQVLDLLSSLCRQRQMAMLFITHDLGVVAHMADRVALMYAGQIVETARRFTFFKSPRHPYAQQLFAALPNAGEPAHALGAIPGTMPRLGQRFEGCRFASRCAHAQSVCTTSEPPWTPLTNGEGVRCFFPLDSNHPLCRSDPGIAAGMECNAPAAAQQRSVLELRGVSVHFPVRKGLMRRPVHWIKAVDDVSLTIAPGSTLALVGESGSGKTTVGRAILRLVPITAGSINFAGDDLSRLAGAALRRRRGQIQCIFQDPYGSLNPRLTVGSAITEGAIALGIIRKKAQARDLAERLLENVGLSPDVFSRYPHEFSGGQRQRVCVARALAANPRLIICDEPTSALDVSVQAQILNLLKRLQVQQGLAYLFITHNMAVAEYLAQRVMVMYKGRVVETGPVQSVLTSPHHPYTQALIEAVPSVTATSEERPRASGLGPSAARSPLVGTPANGCNFLPRCPRASGRCAREVPPSALVGPAHTVHCFLYHANGTAHAA